MKVERFFVYGPLNPFRILRALGLGKEAGRWSVNLLYRSDGRRKDGRHTLLYRAADSHAVDCGIVSSCRHCVMAFLLKDLHSESGWENQNDADRFVILYEWDRAFAGDDNSTAFRPLGLPRWMRERNHSQDQAWINFVSERYRNTHSS